LLKNARLVLDNIYGIYSHFDLEKIFKEDLLEQKNKIGQIEYKFKTSLFDDLIVDIEEVFEGFLEDTFDNIIAKLKEKLRIN